MRILVTGADGQLGRACGRVFADEAIFLASRDQLDITNAQQCLDAVGELDPDVVIHTAAYTNVKTAEQDRDVCWAINVEGTRNIATAAREKVFVHISTDYVFDGAKKTPYSETDEMHPTGIYGKSKAEAEKIVLDLCKKAFTLRTSWLFGTGKNFVQTMLNMAEAKKTVQVVNDQIGCPTYAQDLAGWMKQLLQTHKYGIYHASNSGPTSWAGFAREIFLQAKKDVVVEPITTEQFMQLFGDTTPRPRYSVLDTKKLSAVVGDLRPWKEALADYLAL